MKTNFNQERVWNSLAKVWKGYRQRPWKDVERLMIFISGMKSGKILEIGCGNCRNLLPYAQKGFECYGIDFSNEMLKYAKQFADKNGFKVKLKKARAENLPFKSNSFDYALSIATLHHLKKAEQILAIKEMHRVLNDGGIAIVSVWNKFNPRFWRYLFKKQAFVPWKVDEKTYSRYYYFFSYTELKKMLYKAGFRIIKKSHLFSRNISFVVKKTLKFKKNY